jgi:hypothetical protein
MTSYFTSSIFGSTSTPTKQILKSDNIIKKPHNFPVEHSDDFKIVVILDESGSMQSIQKDIIKSINDLLTEQKQIKERPCRFTLVKFNDKIKRTIKNRDLNKVNELSIEDYTPDRSTSLYDAIGSTVNWFRYEKNVLLVIVTDGQENASKVYTKDSITKMLDEKQKFREWTFVYLCNDLATSSQGDNIGLKQSKFSSNIMVDQSNYGSYLGKNVNVAISNYRKKGISVQQQLNRN